MPMELMVCNVFDEINDMSKLQNIKLFLRNFSHKKNRKKICTMLMEERERERIRNTSYRLHHIVINIP
jgi:hypothetical protein